MEDYYSLFFYIFLLLFLIISNVIIALVKKKSKGKKDNSNTDYNHRSSNSKVSPDDIENDRLEDLFDEHWNDFDWW